MKLPAISIRRKVRFAIFGTIAGSLFLVALSVGWYENAAAEPRLRANLEVLAETMLASIAPAVEFQVPEAAAESLQRLQPARYVTGAVVLSPGGEGKPFARYVRPGAQVYFNPETRPDGFSVSGSAALLVTTYVRDGVPIATLQLEGNLAAVRRGLGRSLALGSLILGAVLIFGAVLARLLQHSITAPLTQLADTAQQVRTTGNFGLRAAVETRDEVGELARRLNELLEAIQQRDRAIGEASVLREAILAGTGVAVVSCHSDGLVRSFNPGAERLLGYTADEVIGRATPELWHDRQEMEIGAAELSQRLGRTLAAGFEMFVAATDDPAWLRREWTFVRKDGTRVPVLLVVSRLTDADGTLIGYVGVATDLSERKRAEAALRASEERYRLIASSEIVGIVVHQEGIIRFANEGVARLAGLESAAAAIGRPVVDFLPPEEQRMFAERMVIFARGEQLPPMEGVRLRRCDGGIVWVQTVPALIVWDGRPAVQTFVVDITKQREAQLALRESEERHRLIVEQTGQMVYELDVTTGRNTWFGDAAVRAITGYELSEFQAVTFGSWADYIHPEDRAAALEAFDRALAAGRPYDVSYRFRRKDGSYRWIADLGIFVRDDGAERFTRMFGTMTDITERFVAEERLRRSERVLRKFSEVTAGVTGQQFFETVVRALAEELQVRYTMIGRFASGPDGQRRVQSVAAWTAGGPASFEFPIAGTAAEKVLADGPVIIADDVAEHFPSDPGLRELGARSYFGVALRSADGEACGVITAIGVQPMEETGVATMLLVLAATRTTAELERLRTEAEIRSLNAALEQRVQQRTSELAQRVAEVERLNREQQMLLEEVRKSQQQADRSAARLQEVNASLMAANQELENFSHSVSHDLRAPLRNIGGFLELVAKRSQGKLDPEAERFMGIVSSETRRMDLLIGDLLTFSQIGRSELRCEQVALNDLVLEVLLEFQTETSSRVIEWKIGELPTVPGDRILLRQVLANLIGNALKFTRHRTPATIQLGANPPTEVSPMVTVFVRDNGAGFNPKYLDRLFGVFQRLHNSREFEGTGIGLANVKRIVERHHGRVWAEGAVDKGATFYVSLPVEAE